MDVVNQSIAEVRLKRYYADLDVQGPEVQATFRDMIDNGVPMTSTLVVYEISVSGRPPIDERVYAFDEVGAAIKAMPEGRHFGKVVVRF